MITCSNYREVFITVNAVAFINSGANASSFNYGFPSEGNVVANVYITASQTLSRVLAVVDISGISI